MAGMITGLEAEAVRAATERVRAEIAEAAQRAGRDPAEVELLAAVKYIELEELGVIAEAGLTIVGENRAQELEAKAAAHPELRWHFIGQLQSRKVKQILPHVELIHSVASDSALRQLERHARRRRRSSSRSMSRGRTARRASPRTSSARSSSALPCGSRG